MLFYLRLPVCLSVSFVCQQDYFKSYEQILMKIVPGVRVPRIDYILTGDPDHDFHSGLQGRDF